MLSELIITLALVSVVYGGVLHHAPIIVPTDMDNEYDPNPHYVFGYTVHDSLTGDQKGQVERRNGDVVHGSYSLNDPDGTRRTVDYTADAINGFNAVVRKTPIIQNDGFLVAPITHLASSDLNKSDKLFEDPSASSAVGNQIPSLFRTSSSVVRSNGHITTHIVSPISFSPYSAPLVNQLAHFSVYENPTLYSAVQRYNIAHYL